jgi:hypothetical protein
MVLHEKPGICAMAVVRGRVVPTVAVSVASFVLSVVYDIWIARGNRGQTVRKHP